MFIPTLFKDWGRACPLSRMRLALSAGTCLSSKPHSALLSKSKCRAGPCLTTYYSDRIKILPGELMPCPFNYITTIRYHIFYHLWPIRKMHSTLLKMKKTTWNIYIQIYPSLWIRTSNHVYKPWCVIWSPNIIWKYIQTSY